MIALNHMKLPGGLPNRRVLQFFRQRTTREHSLVAPLQKAEPDYPRVSGGSIWRPLESLLRKWKIARFRHNIEHALALHKRGEARKDGLTLDQASIRLDIAWRTRDIHPWDRDDPPEKQAALFVQQSLEDTDAAITRLFDTLPQVDSIHLKVLDHHSEKIIMAGTVHRSSSFSSSSPSVKMRLVNRGIELGLVGSQFEPLQDNDEPGQY